MLAILSVWFISSKINSDIELIDSRMRSLNQVDAISKIAIRLQEIRGELFAQIRTNASVDNDVVSQLGIEINTLFDDANLLLASSNSYEIERLQMIKSEFGDFFAADSLYAMNAQMFFEKFTVFVKRLRNLSFHITVRGDTNTAVEISNRELIMLFSNELPKLGDSIGQARGFGSGLLAGENPTSIEKNALGELVLRARQNWSEVIRYNEILNDEAFYSPSEYSCIAGYLQESIFQFVSLSQNIFKDKTIRATAYFQAGTYVINKIEACSDELQTIVLDSQDDQKLQLVKEHWIVIAVAFIGLLGFLISAYFLLKRTQVAALDLIQSENRKQTILETAAEGIITTNGHGLIEVFNPAAEKIFDISSGEAIGLNISKLITYSGDKAKSNGQPSNMNLADGVYQQIGCKKNGDSFPIELAVSTDQRNEGVITTSIIRDISERKELEDKLVTQERQLRDTFNNMPGAIILLDEMNEIVYFNNHIVQMYPSSENLILTGKSYEDVIKFQSFNGYFCEKESEENFTQKLLSLRDPNESMYEVNTPDKRVYLAQKTLLPNGHIIIIFTEITEKRKAENQLKNAQETLIEAEKMAALGGLVAGVAHEINTPVGVSVTAASHFDHSTEKIIGKYETGKMTKVDLEKYFTDTKLSSKIILSNLERAADLINSFKKIAVDQSSEEQREFYLNNYLHEIVLSLRPQLKKTKHQVEISCPEDLLVDGFPGAISQIITNLIANSLIHAFEEDDEGSISICCDVSDGQVKIQYTDSGKGMEASIIKRIFEPFFTTNRSNSGSGLGMHIIYNLVKKSLNGNIECKSELGLGTTFNIAFPRTIATAQSNEAESNLNSVAASS